MNYALQQNGVPVVRRLSLTNEGDAAAEDLEVRCWIPRVSEPWVGRVMRIEPGATYNLDDVRLGLNPGALAGQTEREATELIIEVNVGGQPAAREARAIEVLAVNEWPGVGVMPELLAAFVTPNHPAIDRILRSASELLERSPVPPPSRADGALSGYQTRSPERAAVLAEAIYLAFRACDLSYVNPPASFETGGQKVRSVDQVLEARMGTCLDLALLLASGWEQAGLHPLVIIVEGHALAAFWTREECFPEPVVEEGLRILKRVELGEIVAVEATALTGAGASFAAAVDSARARLRDTHRFLCAVDVRSARRLKIRPLPIAASRSDAAPITPGPVETVPGVHSVLPDQGIAWEPSDRPAAPATPQGRIDRWKRKLLDLSLRNRLLNFRETRLSIPLRCTDLAALENMLAEGAEFGVLPRPGGRSDDPRDPGAGAGDEDPEAAFLREELADKRLRADLTEAELTKRMTELFRAARTSLEESGANTLYLAAGMLHWYEADNGGQERLAPLVLVPLEMERTSAREGFRICQSDDPPRTNVTLLEKLRVDHGLDTRALEELPDDDAGFDLPLVLRRFREAVKNIPRWHITGTAYLGLFSFSKFLMWHDLQEKSDALLQNRVVKYLVDRPDEPFSAEPFPKAAELDRTIPAGELLCPMDADSSQLVAIHSAAQGRSYVLEGPPGTGKSQTITNLIAHAIGQGKRVLFVAEKLAALSVVHRRLERSGLAPWCLELHSNKASKKEVVAQLAESFAAPAAEPRSWAASTAELDRKRAELNAYVGALHTRRASGETFYEVATRLMGLDGAPESPLSFDGILEVTPDRLARYRENVEGLATAASAVEDPAGHPLRGIGRSDWSESLPELIREAARASAGTAEGLLSAAAAAFDVLDPDPENTEAAAGLSWTGQRWLAELARHLLTTPSPTEALITEPGWAEIRATLEAWIARGRARDALRRELFAGYRPEVLDLDINGLLSKLRSGVDKPGPFRWWTCRAPRKTLAAVRAAGGAPEARAAIADLEKAARLKAETAALADAGSDAARLFGRAWKGGEAEWDALARTLEWADSFRTLLLHVPMPPPWTAAIAAAAVRLATTGADALAADTPTSRAMKTLIGAHNAHLSARKELETLVEAEAEIAWGAPGDTDYLPRFRGTLARWTAALGGLGDWCFWRRGRARAGGEGLAALVAALESGSLTPALLRPAFERAYAQQWVRAISDSTDTLRNFNSDAHGSAIDRFRTLDRSVIELAREVLRARLSADIPRPGASVVASSEMGILQRQMALKRGHTPVRKLIQKLPNLLPRLKPCFLMSPLSVAQHLDTSFPPFDLVVFDEASQIPVWDAIGAIARGSEVIVVGDSKQLPPTNFFNRIEGEEETPEDEIEELESILDECNASGIPALRLLWHYRSRHESLIAFSNYHYYGNRLQTFPSSIAASPTLGVSLRHFEDGVYDRGDTRTNRREAEAVVEEIVARLTAGGEPPGRGSIGVVTFNAAQQNLIEDLLDQQRRERPEIEKYFSEGDEPVFVKNLENVQGDERETILFSICYGPDADGRITMNFGPLGHEGGERRLNVAITRARSQVILFSSIRAEDIDLSRTRAVGVAHLKSFLDYADRGPSAIAEATTLPAPPAARGQSSREDPFEASVRRALAERGWETDPRVGCSGYRIDIAVRDPDRAGEYLLGIECDGPFYMSGDTARDRDRLRQQVLESLGWTLHRLWSSDWRLNRAKALERIEDALAAAKRSKARGRPAAPPARQAAAPADSPAPPPTEFAGPPVPSYEPFDTGNPRGTPDDFYAAMSARRLAAAIREIVAKEQPVHVGVVTRRLAALWGIDRITSRVEARVAEVLASDITRSRPRREADVLWTAGADPASFDTYRAPGETPESRRDIDEIPDVEVAAAAMAVLRQQVSLPTEDLMRETARRLGFHRVTPRSEPVLARALDRLIAKVAERTPDGMVSLGRSGRR